ncbi:hypothetical protein BgiBS90_014715 [Biomphalaria glabrata]|nr:hypothetical protein BgiBS90_014715 [Biomphalaria glabrata]
MSLDKMHTSPMSMLVSETHLTALGVVVWFLQGVNTSSLPFPLISPPATTAEAGTPLPLHLIPASCKKRKRLTMDILLSVFPTLRGT